MLVLQYDLEILYGAAALDFGYYLSQTREL
jgi:hypothetical protein